MSFSFDSAPGTPVPSVHADLVRAFQGYDPYARACSATRNSAQLTIPVSPCDKLDEDDFNLWQRALKQSVCHSPLLLLMLRGPGPARAEPTIDDICKAYRPDDVLDSFIIGTLERIGNRVAAYTVYDDPAYGMAAVAGWKYVENYRKVGLARGTIETKISEKASLTNTPRQPVRPRPDAMRSLSFQQTTNTNPSGTPAGGAGGENKTADEADPAQTPPPRQSEEVNLRTLRNETRAVFYDSAKEWMLMEISSMAKARQREWRAANRVLYILITNSIQVETQIHIPEDRVPFGSGVSAFESIRQHCTGDDDAADTVLTKTVGLFTGNSLMACKDFDTFAGPLNTKRRALDALVPPETTYADFMSTLMLALKIML